MSIKEMASCYVIEIDGEKKYFCKKCGQMFESPQAISAHYKSCDGPGVSLEDIKKMYGLEEDKDKTEEKEEKSSSSRKKVILIDDEENSEKDEEEKPKKVLSREELMIEEMKETLRRKLLSNFRVRSMKNYEDLVSQFVDEYFVSFELWKPENEVSLINQLQEVFPKLSPQDIMLILKSIRDIREKYTPNNISPGLILSYLDANQQQIQHQFPVSQQSQQQVRIDPQKKSFEELAVEVFNKMFNSFLETITKQSQQAVNPLNDEYLPKDLAMKFAEIQAEKARYEAEKRILELEKQFYEERIRRLEELVTNTLSQTQQRSSGSEWKDDYARMVKELGEKVLDMTHTIILEGKKTRRMMLKILLPHLLQRQGGGVKKLRPMTQTPDEFFDEFENDEDDEDEL